MRIFRTILTPLLLLLAVVGCRSERATLDAIEHAEHIVKDYPDSALRIVRGVNPDNLRGKRDKMHYRLVLSEALYHNRIDSDCDTLTRPLFDYYMYSDSHAERARAMYQHAMANYYIEENTKAMYAFFEAEKSLNIEDDTRLRGLINLYMGKIYHKEFLFENAIERFKLAEQYFSEIDIQYHRIYSTFYIGKNYLNIRNHEESLMYLTQAKDYTIENGYYELLGEILSDLVIAYYDYDDKDSCAEMLAYYEKYDCLTHNECLYYSYKAIISASQHDFDSAEKYIQLAEKYNTPTAVIVQFAQWQIMLYRKDYKSALTHYIEMIKKQDSDTYKALQHSILNSQLDVLKSDNELISLQNQRIKTQYIYTTIVIVLILLLLIVYIRYRNSQYRHKLSSYVSTIDKLNLICQDINQTKLIQNTIERLYRGNINEISRLCEIYYEHSTPSRLTSKVMAHISNQIDILKNDKNKLSELEEAVNTSYDGLMSKLRECCPSLTEREMRIALYSYVGFSNQAICLLVDVNTERLPKIKYNIREQIKKSNSPYIAQLIAPLSRNKTTDVHNL